MRLTPALDDLYQRHLSHTERANWAYHEFLPWERGKNFQDHPWAPDQGSLSPELTLAVETALLTEINLPWFTSGLVRLFETAPDPLKHFLKTWTAEEDQHSRILDVYLTLSRNGDPVKRAQLRKHVVREGWTVPGDGAFAVMIYTTIQELATRAFYLNLAQASKDQDKALGILLKAIAKDETLHYAFYRDAVRAYLEEDPDKIATVCDIVPRFSMPGSGMPDFGERMKVISRYGGYGPAEYLKQVVQPILQHWGVFEHEVSASTNSARGTLRHYLDRLDRIGQRQAKALASHKLVTTRP